MKKEAAFEIKGMHCKSCAKRIEETLLGLKGVEKAKVSLAGEKAMIEFDAENISLDKIEGEIIKLGYRLSSPSNPAQDRGNEVLDAHDQDIMESSGPARTKGNEKTSIKQGILYGIVPHIGCIGFIAASVLGATVAVEFFKPLLMNPWFFHILVLISIGFATVSAAFYLRKNGLLSFSGLKRKKKYLAAMYGSTLAVNLFLFLFAFPLIANIDTGAFGAGPTGAASLPAVNSNPVPAYSQLRLQVDIPCSGHASLITGELKKIQGVTGVRFEFPNFFDVAFDSGKTTKQEILGLEVFKTYKATLIKETSAQSSALLSSNTAASSPAQTQQQSAASGGTGNAASNPVQGKSQVALGCSIGAAAGGSSSGSAGGCCGSGSCGGGCGCGAG